MGQLPLLPHHPSPTEATRRRVPWLHHPSIRRRCSYHCPPPELATAAYERWRFLYVRAEAVRAAGMPTDVEITTDGTRVLGGPVGSVDYCRSFAGSVVQEVIEDLTSSFGCCLFRRSTALRWVQFSIGLIICGADTWGRELDLWGPPAQVRRGPPQHPPAHDRASFAS